jgi:hypothetical protein|tara:strand:+ start:59 stop:232 length:174 start_codon:yes stop_codon:yes gene_type:complete
MSRQLQSYGINILHLHAEWLKENGYKRQAESCKRQAASLTRKNYKNIVSYKLKEKEL